MKIRIGFSKSNRLISKIIQWFTKGQVSHVYVRLDDKLVGVPLIFHADWPGVVIVHGPLFDKQNIIVEEYEIEDIHLDDALKKHMTLLGKKYDFWNLLGWAWVIAFKRWFKKKIQHPIDDPKKLICVDFVVRITNCAKLTNLPLGVMDPKMLRAWCAEHYEKLGWKKINY